MESPSLKEFVAPQCKNCFKAYALKGDKGRRIPLLLSCGHSFCSNCIAVMGKVQQHSRALTCPECAMATEFSVECGPIDQLVPNIHLLGILAAQSLKLKRVPEYSPARYSVLIRATMAGLEDQGFPYRPVEPYYVSTLCSECDLEPASTKCITCNGVYCQQCFTIVHAASKVLRKHSHIPITQALSSVEVCPAHPLEPLKHYCVDDEVPICSSCCIVGEHKGHAVVPINQAAEKLREKVKPLLSELSRQVRHIKKAEKHLTEKLPQLSTQLMGKVQEVRSSFDELSAVLQRRELALLEDLVRTNDQMCQPYIDMRDSLRRTVERIEMAGLMAQDVMGDDLKLVKTGNKLLSDLMEIKPPTPESNNHSVFRFNLDSAVKQQLLEIGSISLAPAPKNSSFLQHPSHTGDSTTTDDADGLSDTSLSSDLLHPPRFSPPKPATPSGSPPSRGSSRPPSQVSSRRAGSFSPNVLSRPGKERSASPRTGKEVKIEETAEVWITHIESPSEFFVHYTSNSGSVQRMVELVNLHCKRPRQPRTKDVVPGLHCAARLSQGPDKRWYRVVVESCDYPTPTFAPHSAVYVTVVRIDYGNSEIVTLENLATLPDHLTSPPPLCTKCTLHHLSPMSRYNHLAPVDWSPQAITQFKSMLIRHGKEMVRIKEFDREPSGLAHVDLYLPSTGPTLLSVRDRLVSMGMAKRTSSRRTEGEREREDKIPPHTRLYPGESVKVIVPTVNSPGDFYIQMYSSEGDLNCLSDQLNEEFCGVRQTRTAPILQPKKGMFCCCKYSQDNCWYRAQVRAVKGSTVHVEYIDYGNAEDVPSSALTTLPHHLATLPVQAARCTLWGVEPTDGGTQWGDEACDQFYNVATEARFLTMNVCGEGSPVPVLLEDEQTQSLSGILVAQNLARFSEDPSIHTRHSRESSSSDTTQMYPPLPTPPLLTPTHFQVEAKQKKKDEVETTSPSSLKPYTPDTSPPLSLSPPVTANVTKESVTVPPSIPPSPIPQVGGTLDCRVVEITSPTDFHISILCEATTGLNQALAEVRAAPSPKKNWNMGDYALAGFHGDTAWHRVMVQEQCDGGMGDVGSIQYQVFYLDYGNTGIVESSSIVAIPSSLLLPPAQAVRCALVGVCPVGGVSAEGVWSHEASLCFTQLTMEKMAIATVQALPTTPSSPLLISLSLTEDGGMGDVASFLVASGVAIPSPSTPPPLPELEDEGGSPPNSASSPPSLVESEITPPHSTKTDTTTVSGMEASGASPDGYLPSSSPPSGSFTLAVTVVDQEGIIHGHILGGDTPLHHVMESVQSVCPTHPRPQSVKALVVGQPCCALFHEDQLWYRGVVKGINTINNTANVLYVDYGNVELVECSNIVALPVMLDIPIQACAVKLAGMEGKVWTPEEIALLSELVVGLDVLGERVMGKYVSLKVQGRSDVLELFYNATEKAGGGGGGGEEYQA